MARPTVMTPETIAKLEVAYLVGATDQEACCHAGIGMSTLYDYCNNNPKFSDKKEVLKNQPIMKAKIIVSDSLDKGDLTTAHRVIDRKEGQKVDITSGGKEIKNNFIIQPVTTKEFNNE